ncbi:hypothetical protein [Arcobacter sp. L]|uniref:hypothetical protein n=1 Tax=Arcobacter sp. L TaxID=944547 RepID=UPI0002296588|nr:hypothetical protein [Arcobacter sp. L]BAK73248.1 conserved hypothetical protein [Arcobacter sp. L]
MIDFEKFKKNILTISFFSFLISIGYIVYTEFIKEDKAILSFDMVSVLNVLDVTNKLDDDLKVLYKNIDILKQNKKLSIINIKIENKGNMPILLENYDKEFPLGFSLDNGNILKVNIIESSSEYISQKLSKIEYNYEKIILPYMIIDSHNYLLLSILVLHNENTEILINPFGKIANIKSFLIENAYKKQNYSFWDDLIEGSIWIKIARSFFYFFSFLIIIFIIGFTIATPIIIYSSIEDIIKNYIRKKNIEKYKKYMMNKCGDIDEIIFDLYKEEGDSFVDKLKNVYNENYNEIISDYKEIKISKEKEKKKREEKEPIVNKIEEYKKYSNYNEVNDLIKKKILDDEGNIDSKVSEAFNNFREYLYKNS